MLRTVYEQFVILISCISSIGKNRRIMFWRKLKFTESAKMKRMQIVATIYRYRVRVQYRLHRYRRTRTYLLGLWCRYRIVRVLNNLYITLSVPLLPLSYLFVPIRYNWYIPWCFMEPVYACTVRYYTMYAMQTTNMSSLNGIVFMHGLTTLRNFDLKIFRNKIIKNKWANISQ